MPALIVRHTTTVHLSSGLVASDGLCYVNLTDNARLLVTKISETLAAPIAVSGESWINRNYLLAVLGRVMPITPDLKELSYFFNDLLGEVLDRLLQLAADREDIAPRRSHQLHGWLYTLKEINLQGGATVADFVFTQADCIYLPPCLSLAGGAAAAAPAAPPLLGTGTFSVAADSPCAGAAGGLASPTADSTTHTGAISGSPVCCACRV